MPRSGRRPWVLVAPLFFLLSSSLGCVPSRPANVIVIVLDTTRADQLSLFDASRDTTPFLADLRKEFSHARYAISTSPWTPPAVASLFTGLYPSAHSMMPPNDLHRAEAASARLPDEALTLAEMLKERGFSTYAVSSNPWVSETFGFHQGFELFKHFVGGRGEKITEAAIELLDDANPDQPFFLYLHYFDPHEPYKAPRPYRGMFRGSRDDGYSPSMQGKLSEYREELRYLDDQLARLFAELKDKELFEDSIVVLVGDHGEQFEEHGDWGHGFSLYDEELHVPLMIRAPDLPGTIEETVSLVDIAPTIVEALRIADGSSFQGVSLRSASARKQRGGVMSEIKRLSHTRALTDPAGSRLILNYSVDDDFFAAGNGVVDAVSCRSGAGCKPADLEGPADGRLMRDLDDVLAASGRQRLAPAGVVVPEARLEELRALGYAD